MGEHAGQNERIESRQNESGIFQAFVDSQLDIGGSQKESVSTEQVHSRFGGHPRPGTSFLKDHTDGIAQQRFFRTAVVVLLLVVVRQIQKSVEFVFGKLTDAHKVLPFQTGESLLNARRSGRGGNGTGAIVITTGGRLGSRWRGRRFSQEGQRRWNVARALQESAAGGIKQHFQTFKESLQERL